jgi:peptidoglycan L-alanyl-D-glutamate endopeptidase CwlK
VIHREERLRDVDPRLASVVRCVGLDLLVVCGARSKENQEKAFHEKRSKVQFPNSKHNVDLPKRPFSEAVDLAPHPVDWGEERAFYVLAGAVLQEAIKQGVCLRWGGDWDGDGGFDDQTFNDLGHFELSEKKTLEVA